MTGERGLVVVTGGSRGIGRGVVARLAADGYSVASVSSRPPDEQPDARAGTYAVDVADEPAVIGLFERLDAIGIPLVGAVTAAGVNERADAISASADLFRRVLEVNVVGTFLVAREAARRMTSGGSIVTMSSTMAFVGSRRRQAPYSASKGAVRALTTALAVEWSDRKIRVNSIAPTFTETEMNAPVLADPELSELVLASIPLGRFGRISDVADAAAWLLGDESTFITGHTLPVDGGYLAQ